LETEIARFGSRGELPSPLPLRLYLLLPLPFFFPPRGSPAAPWRAPAWPLGTSRAAPPWPTGALLRVAPRRAPPRPPACYPRGPQRRYPRGPGVLPCVAPAVLPRAALAALPRAPDALPRGPLARFPRAPCCPLRVPACAPRGPLAVPLRAPLLGPSSAAPALSLARLCAPGVTRVVSHVLGVASRAPARATRSRARSPSARGDRFSV
jgi:hypothetical protein